MEKALKIPRKQLAVIAAVVALILVIATCQWRAAEDRRREEEIVTAQGLVQVIDATFSEQNALKVGQVSGRLDVTTVDPGMVETEFSVVRFHGDRDRANAVYQGVTPLTATDVADAVLYCVTRPSHVNVHEMLLMPTDQATSTIVNRRA